MIIDQLIEKIIAMQNPTCVGLDTQLDYLPAEMREGVETCEQAADAILAFNKKIVDSVCDIVPAVKVQIAYYEQYGAAGVAAFLATVAYAKEKGLFVIADCKRNDIGSTAARYSAAYLGETALGDKTLRVAGCDFLTVNAYLGTDGVAPFLDDCKKFDTGLFILVKTSNSSSGELQDLKLADGRTVYECMGDMVEGWGAEFVGKYGYSAIGAVVGATHPAEAKILRDRLAHTFFLVPGYGAQGGNAEMLKNCFDKNGLGGIVNNSRGILCAYKKNGGTYYEAARAACMAMQKDLVSVLGEICAK
ncbi:MAG TPA: orotidine-5'-phosphate decarboxylase [Firmicutes bacterium]|nr:orotidine-5'-phosphate decarboxylase [Bacillota bacterium]